MNQKQNLQEITGEHGNVPHPPQKKCTGKHTQPTVLGRSGVIFFGMSLAKQGLKEGQKAPVGNLRLPPGR